MSTDNLVGQTITSYTFISQEERSKMVLNTEFICIYEDTIVKFDPVDETFWAFGRYQKVKLTVSEVRKLPEVRIKKLDLAKFKKK